MSLYQHQLERSDGILINMADYKNRVLLIVNTASYCGFTPQYKELSELHQHYQAQGLEVWAFPCNQFGKQEPGNSSEIVSFCTLNYNLKFPIFSKVKVNGEGALPFFTDLKKRAPGLLGTQKIKWNFTKFLVSREGDSVKRYAPSVSPLSISKDIEKLLA
jgi:glutathione peroxidase